MNSQWLDWALQLQALAQTGLAYPKDPFDVARYEQVRAIAAEMLAASSGADPAFVRDLFAGEVGHATPKIDVRAVVFRDGAILLVRERSDGKWTLPGGWADVGESAGESVVREVYEESGYHTRAVKLLAVYDRNKHGHPPIPHHAYKLFFRCELLGGEPAHSVETDGVAFFPPDALPELSVTRVTAAQIAHCFEHERHPEWPTDFD
jgi:ADP-ribose pyrophosphatase YjhB (NUDIX family)